MGSTRTEKLLAAKRSYYEKPFPRRSRTCEGIISGGMVTMIFVGTLVTRAARVSENEIYRWILVGFGGAAVLGFVFAVLFVCVLALTGPVYKQQLDFKRGELETWGYVEKGAAMVISGLVIAGAAFIAQRVMF